MTTPLIAYLFGPQLLEFNVLSLVPSIFYPVFSEMWNLKLDVARATDLNWVRQCFAYLR